VLGAGIGGNRLLSDVANSPSTLSRFDRDVLGQAGVTHVIVLQGITDIMAARSGPSPSAADLIAGYRQLIARAHAKGLKIIGGTLTPFEGSAAFTTEGEAKRQAVNAWIRTAREYDALIDFDAFVRDSSQPSKLRAEYHCGDFLHPSELGYRTMASGIDLAIFSGKF
jgi:lysophospholipase L1-like esterase